MTPVIPDFSTARVLIAGDVMLDRYWHGSTLRISPEAPVPVVKIGGQEFRAGGAGNVALNIAALGCGVELLGIVGDDDAAGHLRGCLKKEGLACHLITVPGMQTITKLRVVSRHQQLIRLDFEDDFNEIIEIIDSHFDALFYTSLNNVDAVVLSDYAKGTLQNSQRLIAHAKMRDLPVVVDPKSKDFSIYSGASILTPNLAEFEAVVGCCHNEKLLIAKAKMLCSDLGLEALLVTRGELGMILVGPNISTINLPANVSEVFDVTGAGDTVVAVLACSLAVGGTLPDSVALANIAAGLVVGKLGAASITRDELNVALEPDFDSIKRIVSEDDLLMLVRKAKQAGERVVMTNGCFDIMHPGHIAYLAEARSLGDKLIVAVNDDASVAALKGSGRPLNSLEERMLMLSSLRSVDWVVSFSENTPERLIHLISPNVLVKGGDYIVSEIAGGEHVEKQGGEVRVLNFIKGYSSTSLINKIRQGSVEQEYA